MKRLKMEAVFQSLINEDVDTASEILHELLVETSRSYYEQLIEEEADADPLVEVVDEDEASFADEVEVAMGDEEEVEDEAEEEAVEDKVEDLESQLAELMAKFEEIKNSLETEEDEVEDEEMKEEICEEVTSAVKVNVDSKEPADTETMSVFNAADAGAVEAEGEPIEISKTEDKVVKAKAADKNIVNKNSPKEVSKVAAVKHKPENSDSLISGK